MKIVDETCIEQTSENSRDKNSKSVVENIINFLKESKKKKDGIGVSTSVGIGVSTSVGIGTSTSVGSTSYPLNGYPLNGRWY